MTLHQVFPTLSKCEHCHNGVVINDLEEGFALVDSSIESELIGFINHCTDYHAFVITNNLFASDKGQKWCEIVKKEKETASEIITSLENR